MIQSVRNSCTASASSGIGVFAGRFGGTGLCGRVGAPPSGADPSSELSPHLTAPHTSDHQLPKPFHRPSWRRALSPDRTSELEEVRWPLNNDCGALLAR